MTSEWAFSLEQVHLPQGMSRQVRFWLSVLHRTPSRNTGTTHVYGILATKQPQG